MAERPTSEPSLPLQPAAGSPLHSRGAAIVGMLIAFMGGYLLGAMGKCQPGGEAYREAAAAQRFQIPVASSPSDGPDDAPVTIVEFADFQCPGCALWAARKTQLLAEFSGTVRWVFKQFPFDFHPDARKAARAALAAHAQGQFWAFHDRLFADQDHMTTDDLMRIARDLRLDMARFRADLDGGATERLVNGDLELARGAGVRATPSFFVNGRRLDGGIQFIEFDRILRQELSWATELVRRGVPRAQIYEELTKPAAPAAPRGPTSQPASRPTSTSALQPPPAATL